MSSALAYIVAVLVAVPALYGSVYGGARALHAWQYGRCLARIEKLERELAPTVHPRSTPYQRCFAEAAIRSAQDAADRYARNQRRRSGKRGMWYGS